MESEQGRGNGGSCAPESATLPFPTLKSDWGGGQARWDPEQQPVGRAYKSVQRIEPRVSGFQIVGDPQQQNLSADSVSRYKHQPCEHLSPKSTLLSEDRESLLCISCQKT